MIYTLAHGSINDQIKGVRTTVDVLNLGRESGRSCWCAMHIGTNVWMQVGYRNNAVPIFEYYYGTITDELIIGDGAYNIIKGQKNTFFIRQTEGNRWEVGVNDKPVRSFDGGFDYGSNPQTAIEYGGAKTKFPLLNFYPAIEVLVNGLWITPPHAYIKYKGKWGIEGNLQNTSLKVNELNMAGATPTTATGFLWIN